MSGPSDEGERGKKDLRELRQKIIGLGERSLHKSYYPELQKKIEELQASNLAKSEFLNVASHELRTPLTSLRLLIVLASRNLEKGRSVDSETLKKIDAQLDRLSNIVEQLLDVSRLESGVIAVERKNCNWCDLIKTAVSDFTLRVPDREVRLSTPRVCPRVEVDPLRIEQVIIHLLDNAARYSPETTPVEILVEDGGKSIRTSVTDHGPGISMEEQRRIFSQFYRTSDSRKRTKSGLGLGLYLCKRIVEEHRGQINFRSDESGSTFYFELPKAA